MVSTTAQRAALHRAHVISVARAGGEERGVVNRWNNEYGLAMKASGAAILGAPNRGRCTKVNTLAPDTNRSYVLQQLP